MSLYTLCPYEQRQYFDDNGNPLAGGKLSTFLAGTSTPVFTFSDSTGTQNTNPITLSASGRCRIYLDPLLAYKFTLTDANGVAVGLPMDPVSLNQATLSANVFQASTRGTVAAPAFSFVADADTGIWSSAANTLDVSTAGAQRMRFHPSGGVSVNTTTDPGANNFNVGGSIYPGAGSASTPSVSFSGDSNTGFYSVFADGIGIATGGALSVTISGTPTGVRFVTIGAVNGGAGAVTGNQLIVGNNGSGGGASGVLNINGKGGASNYIWPDASSAPGQLRISTAAPEEDGTPSDTSGTIVGTQVSWHEFKSNIVPTEVTPDEALSIVTKTKVYEFEYPGGGMRDGDDKPVVFTGFVGYDRNDWFLTNSGTDQNPALDQVTIAGYYALAFQALDARIVSLEAALAAKEKPRRKAKPRKATR